MPKHISLPAALLLLACACTTDDTPQVSFVAAPDRQTDAGRRDAAPACHPSDERCSADADCCTGFCDVYVYGDPVCVAPLPSGYYCQSAAWCESGVCADGVCIGPAVDAGTALPADAGTPEPVDAGLCSPPGYECEADSNCCDDGYCVAYYVQGYCEPKRDLGEWCWESRQCRTGNCSDEQCRMAECTAAEGSCYSDMECCEGFCTYSGMTYAPGECAPRQAAGATCAEHQECLSWSCVEGACR